MLSVSTAFAVSYSGLVTDSYYYAMALELHAPTDCARAQKCKQRATASEESRQQIESRQLIRQTNLQTILWVN